VALPPADALALWIERWPGFVGGSTRVVEVDGKWPEPGATLVWQSGPAGRGRVTETVSEYDPQGRLASRVSEKGLSGVQTVTFETDGDETWAELALEYELARYGGTYGKVMNVLFMRRPLRDSLVDTLGRFAAETEAQSAAR
jgi:hypothetical protein